jgi:hypothetical protein
MAVMTYYVALAFTRTEGGTLSRVSRRRPEARTKRCAWPARWQRRTDIAGPSRSRGLVTLPLATSRMP